VEQGQLDLVHVQADELRIKGCKMIAWMGLAMMVSTRLWLAGTVSLSRDKRLTDRLMQQVRACGQALRAVLVCTDGFRAYPGSIRRAFREKVKLTPGCGRACLQVWPQLVIGTVIKRSVKKRVVEVTRRVAYGSRKRAAVLLRRSAGGTMLNTAFIERLNGTMRERLASLTRKCRHAARRLEALHSGMYLLGTTYNFCWVHHELSVVRDAATGKRHASRERTPAMAAGLTDHVWSVCELLCYKIAPSPWVESKRRRRPRKQARSEVQSDSSRLGPLLRLRKGVLCSTTT
jgi:IS1 family transposase